jgi:hypothetical protein
MVAEDVRDLQRRARHARRALGGRLVFGLVFGLVLLGRQRSEPIQRAHDLADQLFPERRIAVNVRRADLKK